MGDRFILSDGCVITAAGKRVQLTAEMATVLGRLWKRAAGDVTHCVTTQKLARAIWGGADRWPDCWREVICGVISALRKRLHRGGAKFRIHNERGFGYRLIGELTVEVGDPD